jgi:hypothetical protein
MRTMIEDESWANNWFMQIGNALDKGDTHYARQLLNGAQQGLVLLIRSLHHEESITANKGNKLAFELVRLGHDSIIQLNRMLYTIKKGKNVFLRHGGVWIVQYDNVLKVYPVTDTKGMAYIHKIIENSMDKNADKGLTPPELFKAVNPAPATDKSKNVDAQLQDAESNRKQVEKDDQEDDNRDLNTPEVKARLWEQQQNLQTARETGDKSTVKTINKIFRQLKIVRVDEVNKEIIIVQRSSAKSGKIPVTKEADKMRDAVRKRIQESMHLLRRSLPGLFSHLKATMKTRHMKWSYTPATKTDWQTQ